MQYDRTSTTSAPGMSESIPSMPPIESKVTTEVATQSTYSELKTTLTKVAMTPSENKANVVVGEASVETGEATGEERTGDSSKVVLASVNIKMTLPAEVPSKTGQQSALPSAGDTATLAPSGTSASNAGHTTLPRTPLTALAPKAAPLAPDHNSLNSTPTTKPQPVLNDTSQSTRDPGLPQEIHTNIPLTKSSSPAGQATSSKSSSGKSGATLRRGKWTVEEEAYVARVIQDFNSGFLNASAGTTLRSYLSEKLQCDPMRITKKFTGEACIGKRVFHPAVRSAANASAIDKAQAELDALERRWRRRLEMQQRESAKKAAASAAAANAASGGARMIQGVPVAFLTSNPHQDASSQPVGQNVVTQAASWLDRANAILKGTKVETHSTTPPPSTGSNNTRESPESLPSTELENQMQEVQRLIYEGPIIHQTTAGLPNLLANQNRHRLDLNPPSPPEPADKRMRMGSSISGAEDAEALVGFLRSVRASAAASNEA